MHFLKLLILFSLSLTFLDGHNHRVGREGKYDTMNSQNIRQKRIILLGASVGGAWDISRLPERVNNYDYVFEYIPHGGFDKSKSLIELLSRQENRPDAIFIKECAAYFPGDMDKYKSLIKEWIKECLEHNVLPIPVTVVPVTRLHPFKKFLIDIIRIKNPLRSGNPFKKNKKLAEYNDWIKQYSKNLGLSVLDLEASLRYSEKNRYLREDLARIDGLHVNRKAYGILDQIVIPTLETVGWGRK